MKDFIMAQLGLIGGLFDNKIKHWEGTISTSATKTFTLNNGGEQTSNYFELDCGFEPKKIIATSSDSLYQYIITLCTLPNGEDRISLVAFNNNLNAVNSGLWYKYDEKCRLNGKYQIPTPSSTSYKIDVWG